MKDDGKAGGWRGPRVALTGGIACGKSQAAAYLNELGVETLDADDIVHRLVPADERRRLAKVVFADPSARKELEARLHPIVQRELEEWFDAPHRHLKVAIIPLLFEVHWDEKYDIICAVICEKDKQIERMTTTRGYTREEAENRLAAQLPVGEKAEKSHYVIRNDGSLEELKRQVAEFVSWLRKKEEEGDRR